MGLVDLKGVVPMSNHVYDALRILIELSRDAQLSNQKYIHVNEPDPKWWLVEKCTIKIMSSRGSGHTEAIRRLIFEDGMNIGYFAYNSINAKDFRRTYKQKLEDSSSDCGELVFCKSFREDNSDIYKGVNFVDLDAIVVDHSFMLSENRKKLIYDRAIPVLMPFLYGHNPARVKCFYFIFLQ